MEFVYFLMCPNFACMLPHSGLAQITFIFQGYSMNSYSLISTNLLLSFRRGATNERIRGGSGGQESG